MVKRRVRKQYDATFKAKVALAAARGDKTVGEVARQFGLHGNLISQWKQKLLANVEQVFAAGNSGEREEQSELLDDLYQQIGRMKVELEWLKKKLPSLTAELRRLIDPDHAELSVARQCALLGLARSTRYYQSVNDTTEDLQMMRLMDEWHMKRPFYGSRRMALLLRQKGYEANRAK